MLLISSACATPLSALTATRELALPVQTFTVRTLPERAADEAAVAKAIEEAAPALSNWGTLPQPVVLYVTPDHSSLEWAVGRLGYGWLRAWAKYDDVIVQSPASWKASEVDLRELLTHEITHCLMYQHSGTPSDWARKQIPLWFREGMATWTAGQGYRWMTLEDLAHVYAEGPKSDPIARAEELYQDRSNAVYAAAHHAFTFLEHRYGREGVRRVMDHMGAGELFPAAFREAIGIDAEAFTAEFRRYVLWRGFRGNGRPVRAATSAP